MISLLRNPRRWWLFSLAVLLLAAGWTWASRVPSSFADAGQIPSPRAGFPAPDFTLQTLEGDTISLAEQRGQVVIINVWASWCGPCQAEMPAMQQIYAANRERGLQILAVNSTIQDKADAARTFVADHKLTFPILLDADGDVTRRYLVRALPNTFIVDRRGVIREALFGGPLSEATLQSKIDALLDEAP